MESVKISVEELTGDKSEEIRELLSHVDHPSVFEEYGDFQILVIRRIDISHAALFFSSSVFLMKNNLVYLHEPKEDGFHQLQQGYRKMVELLHQYYSSNQKIISGYSDEIEKLEDSLFERSVPNYFIDVWFDLKKDLAKIENFYYRNGLVYKEFYKRSEASFLEWLDDFKDIEDLIAFHNSNLVTLKSRMDSLHHYFDSIKAEKLNKTLLALTLISGFFLPLNLVVGFFGMNTEGLYFKGDPHGTQSVLIILCGIILVLLVGAPVGKMIDRYLLRLIFGKYDFYKNISSRIHRVDESVKPK